MASYKIDQAQRDRLDRMVLDALRPGMSPIAEIADRVRSAMIATRERWAITYSRDATFEHQVGNSLRRWRVKGRAERGTNPRVSEWRLVETPPSISTEEFDAALLELIEEATPETLVGVPGVYEALSETWNNDIIKRALEARRET